MKHPHNFPNESFKELYPIFEDFLRNLGFLSISIDADGHMMSADDNKQFNCLGVRQKATMIQDMYKQMYGLTYLHPNIIEVTESRSDSYDDAIEAESDDPEDYMLDNQTDEFSFVTIQIDSSQFLAYFGFDTDENGNVSFSIHFSDESI